jgi:GTP-binding protein Era
MSTPAPFRSGFAALIGRPNSGKSTLLNAVLGEELSPVTPLPQTTRRAMRGVYTTENMQIVFLDTPGIHRGRYRINDAMLREARNAANGSGADCVCYLVDLSREFGDEETMVAQTALAAKTPLLVVFNKADVCGDVISRKAEFFRLFPGLAQVPSVTLAAIKKDAAGKFITALQPFIKEGPRYFDGESLTDASLRFFAAEFLRKQIILNTREEVPHASFVEIESYREEERRHTIAATIHVETVGQRGIVIGKKVSLLQKIRTAAEADLGRLAGCPVFISCHVTVTPGWRDNKRIMQLLYPE